MDETALFKKKLERVFTRRGGEGVYVKLFGNLSAPQQKRLLELFPVRQSELPVLGGDSPATFSLLLTTERLFWKGGDEALAVELKEIAGVVLDLRAQGISPRSKAVATVLQVDTVANGKLSINVEEGYPYFGLLNVLTFIGSHNVGGTTS